MNVYKCQVHTHHSCAAVVVVAEHEDEAITLAKEEVKRQGYLCDTIDRIEVISLDVKQAYVLAEWGY